MDCRQYLNCWRGRGTVQSCSPGTMFNPRTKECDNPSKVKCGHYEGLSTNQHQRQFQPVLNQRFSQRQELAPIKCESGASGLFAHPDDCTKFLNCDNGRTFIQECGPGTAFNDVFKVCDWPHKVDCGDRPLNGQSNTNTNSYSNHNQNTNSYPNQNTNSYNSNQNVNSYPNQNTNSHENSNSNPYNSNSNSYPNTNSYPNSHTNSHSIGNSNSYTNGNSNSHTGTYSETREEPSFYGEGAMDVRMNTGPQSSRAHSQPPFPHHQQPNLNHRPYQPPQFPRNNIRNYQYPAGQQQSNDGINTLNSFSSANPAYSSPTSFTAAPINPAFDSIHQYPDQTPQESAPKTQIVQIPSENLLPPLETPISSNRTGRIENNFQGQADPRLDWGQIGNVLDSSTQPIQTSVDNSFLTQQTTQSTPQQYPGLNFMSSRVADDFNKYFSNSPPKSTQKVPPPTTTERSTTATKVYSVYPSGFETIGSKCEEDRTGLHAHPYDCSRYISCENGRLTVENCEAGFMFNPTLKICDFAPNVKNCNARPVDDLYSTEASRTEPKQNGRVPFGESGFNGLPDDSINEIYGENEQKKHKTPTPSTRFGYSQTTQATSTNPTAFSIPDMSVLPLENRRYPQNTYPVEHNPQWPQNSHPESTTESKNVMRISHGSHHGPQNTANNHQNGQNFHNQQHNSNGYGWKPSQGGDIEPDTFESRIDTQQHREPKRFDYTETTTESRNVMKIPSGHEHVMPIYHRPTQTPTSTHRPYSSPQSYNHIYYQPFTKPVNETQEKDETDYIPISEALKYLLRPYIARNDTKALNSTDQMTKIEDKLRDMVDDGTKAHGKALEQDSLATALLNVDVAVKNLPESPQTELRSDVELVARTTEKRYFEETTPYTPPAAHLHPHNHNSFHPSFAPGLKHSPEFHAQHPLLNHPQYYKPGTNDPVPITFPGAQSQSHPHHGYYHHTSGPSDHGPSPSLTQMHSSHFHNGHPHFAPNYHSNAPNFGWAQNNRNSESTTPTSATAPSPNSFGNTEKPTTATRFGKTQYGEVSTCDGQFDCGTGFCIPFSQVRTKRVWFFIIWFDYQFDKF